ncbi:hypothetical protein ES703_58662 [subsurface metagenome]
MSSEIKEKVSILNQLGTKELVTNLDELIDKVASLQETRQASINENPDFLGSFNHDCEAIKGIEAQMLLDSPEFDTDGKKVTVDRRQAWLEAEKRKNEPWLRAMAKQRELTGLLAGLDIEIEKTARRYAALKSFLELRTAQINLLGK